MKEIIRRRRGAVLSGYLALTKPGITASVLAATAIGYYLGGHGAAPLTRLFFLLVGAGLSCAGSAALNQYLEREFDARMVHTQDRPLPTGTIAPVQALNFGMVLVLAGLLVLYLSTNLLTAFLSLLTSFIYIVVYTPLKRLSWLNTSLGAVAGALPPVGGWAAATGGVGWGAGILFLLLFVWQHPHFYAIAWMFREDYRRAGFKMLSAAEPTGKKTFSHILFYSLALAPLSLAPVLAGLSGGIYAAGAVLLGVLLAGASAKLFVSGSDNDARALFRTTVFYLPLLLVLIVVDGMF